jgi:hypothetical protein
MTTHTIQHGVRRKLKFNSLDEVMPEDERLLLGHTTVGRWTLGQICNHLELAIRLPMEAVPVKFSWVRRRLFGPVAFRLAMWFDWMPDGVSVPEIYLPPPERDASRDADALRATIEWFKAFGEGLDEHPLLGRLTRMQWERFHRLHCAHHLSFAVPLTQR